MSTASRQATREANARRQAGAAGRDAELAAAIRAADVYGDLPGRRRDVVDRRAAMPASSWTEIGAALAVSKDAAYGLWRQVLRHPAVRALTERQQPKALISAPAPAPEVTPEVIPAPKPRAVTTKASARVGPARLSSGSQGWAGKA